MRLTNTIGSTNHLPKMLEKVLSKDGTFFFYGHKKSPGGGCRQGKMSVDKVLDFAAEGFCQTDNHIDLGFAQVILFLLVELHHAQSNAGCVAEL